MLKVDRENWTLGQGMHRLSPQTVSYAGMLSRWGVDDFRKLFSDEDPEAFADFLEGDVDDINPNQRLLLVAGG